MRLTTEVTNTSTLSLLDINEMYSALYGTGAEEYSRNITWVGTGQPQNRCVDSCQWKHIFLLSTVSKPALKSTQSSVHWVLGAVSHVGKANGK